MENVTTEVTGATVTPELTMEQVATGAETPAVPEVTPEVKEVVTEGESPTPVVDTEPETQDSVQKRINKVIAEKYEAIRRADALQAKLDAAIPATPALPLDAPQLEDFDYDEGKHQEAVIQYQVNKALASQQEVTTKQHAEQTRQKVVNEFTTKEVEYINTHPDYAEGVSSLPRFNQETLDAIYELGPQVSHYLAKHLDIANEVANASSTMAAVRLGQISMGLSADNKTIKPTTAPEPVKTLAGGGSISKSQDEMSMDEIMALP